jgi:hypothetical protein
MPSFERVKLAEAKLRTVSGKRARIIQEYVAYIEQLGQGEAGKLQPSEGENVAAVRRRLGAAARGAGISLTIKRAGDEVYFWVERRGRPKKSS